MKYIKGYLLLGLTLILGSCSDFLDRDPDQILTNDQIFSDAKMINSVLAGFYGNTENWGQSFATPASFTKVDDGCVTDGGRDNMQEYSDNQWRVYPYKYIRNLNQLSGRSIFKMSHSIVQSFERGDLCSFFGIDRSR